MKYFLPIVFTVILLASCSKKPQFVRDTTAGQFFANQDMGIPQQPDEMLDIIVLSEISSKLDDIDSDGDYHMGAVIKLSTEPVPNHGLSEEAAGEVIENLTARVQNAKLMGSRGAFNMTLNEFAQKVIRLHERNVSLSVVMWVISTQTTMLSRTYEGPALDHTYVLMRNITSLVYYSPPGHLDGDLF